MPRPSWAAPVVSVLFIVSPQIALYQGIVWKDILFANATVAGFVAQAHFSDVWEQQRRRYGLIVTSFLFLILATLTRQNGAIMLITGTLSLLWIWLRNTDKPRAAASASAAVLLLSALCARATAALSANSFRKPVYRAS